MCMTKQGDNSQGGNIPPEVLKAAQAQTGAVGAPDQGATPAALQQMATAVTDKSAKIPAQSKPKRGK